MANQCRINIPVNLSNVIYVVATRQPVEEDCIAFVTRESLQALEYMHRAGKIHRDIKVSDIHRIYITIIHILPDFCAYPLYILAIVFICILFSSTRAI